MQDSNFLEESGSIDPAAFDKLDTRKGKNGGVYIYGGGSRSGSNKAGLDIADLYEDTHFKPELLQSDPLEDEFVKFLADKEAIEAQRDAISNALGVDADLITVDEADALTRDDLNRMDIGEIFDALKDKDSPTAQTFRKMIGSLEDATYSSEQLGNQLDRIQKKAKNPQHYVTKTQKKNRKKPVPAKRDSKLFGRSKSIVFVKGRNGEPKPTTIKNAKKFGHL